MPIPKYQQIENDLKNQILNGEFESGDRFYSESELIKRYGVSSITVVRAIKDLVVEGYLVREQGRGTFVSRARHHRPVEFSDIEMFSEISDTETVEIISFERANDPEIRQQLNLDQDETYHRIVRLRRISGIPFLLQVSHIPSRFIRNDVEPDYYQSIYQRFRSDFGIQLNDQASCETNEVIFPAEEKIARLMELNGPEPCVLQRKVTTLSNGRVAEYIVSYKKWDYYKIKITSPNIDRSVARFDA